MKYQDAQVVQQIVINLLNTHEREERRKSQILEQFTTMMSTISFKTIDQKSKDAFSRRFNSLKTFVTQLWWGRNIKLSRKYPPDSFT